MRIFLTFLVSLFMAGQVFAVSLEDDVVGYTKIFNGERGSHLNPADALSYAGISDPRVFDVIERLLVGDLPTERYEGEQKNRLSRYIRALGYSGQEKYIPTLQNFTTDKIYGRYAKAALLDLPHYGKWNPVISNRATFDPALSDDANRVMNMLKSDDVLLNRVGAKRVFIENRDDVLLDQLAAKLTAHYLVSAPDGESADSVAWMAKGLGAAKSERYRPLLEQVMTSTPNGPVWAYAKAALEQYSR